jgi:hypothetical protein
MAWSVDRLGRSLQDLVGFLGELHALGIDLFLHQQGLDTRTPAGKAMFQMLGVFAEFERAMIQERVRAGLARAREGKRLGRPGAPAAGKGGCHMGCVSRSWPSWRACDCRAVQGQPVDGPTHLRGNELTGASPMPQDVPRLRIGINLLLAALASWWCPRGNGRFAARYGGRLVVAADGARVLVKWGLDSDAP